MSSMEHGRKMPHSPNHLGNVLQRGREMNCNVVLHHEGGSVPLQHMPTAHPSDLGKHITVIQGLAGAFVRLNSQWVIFSTLYYNHSLITALTKICYI